MGVGRHASLALGLAVALLLGGCTAMNSENHATGGSALPHSDVGALVKAITTRTVTPLPTARLDATLIPPTNRWFSGMVFGDVSMPVFPLPLSFRLTTSGYSFGVPLITTSSKLISGGFAGDVAVDVGAQSQSVSAYDEASVTITQRAGGQDLGRTVIAEGSPFVSFTASRHVNAHLGNSFAAGAEAWTATIAGTRYGLVTTGSVSGSGTDIDLEAGQTATWFALARGGSLATFAAAARHPLISTRVTFAVSGRRAHTSIQYNVVGGGPTVVAAMPHQYGSLDPGVTCDAGSYSTVYGDLHVCEVSALAWSVATVEPTGSLDLGRLSSSDRATLIQQLGEDIATTPAQPADTYYGGKWLYRLANMLQIARHVGAADMASTLTSMIVTSLTQWMDPAGCSKRESMCFVYDKNARGVVGLTPSFGSDQFNDHHFHWGYFLYTAGVVAADDPELASRWAPVMNLLAADLATATASPDFPIRRVFDAYAGHSWASGTAPFADGNNQESSSEAVSAWNGLALWANATGQSSLALEAKWMLSAEAASALAYSTNFPLDAAVYRQFDHSVTSLDWGGKRDYATWFSAEPSAMLGILVLPMSPVARYLSADPTRISKNLADATPRGFDVVFGDYLLMYLALSGPAGAAKARSEVPLLNEDRIDDGDSRSYLLAWVMSRE